MDIGYRKKMAHFSPFVLLLCLHLTSLTLVLCQNSEVAFANSENLIADQIGKRLSVKLRCCVPKDRFYLKVIGQKRRSQENDQIKIARKQGLYGDLWLSEMVAQMFSRVDILFFHSIELSPMNQKLVKQLIYSELRLVKSRGDRVEFIPLMMNVVGSKMIESPFGSEIALAQSQVAELGRQTKRLKKKLRAVKSEIAQVKRSKKQGKKAIVKKLHQKNTKPKDSQLTRVFLITMFYLTLCSIIIYLIFIYRRLTINNRIDSKIGRKKYESSKEKVAKAYFHKDQRIVGNNRDEKGKKHKDMLLKVGSDYLIRSVRKPFQSIASYTKKKSKLEDNQPPPRQKLMELVDQLLQRYNVKHQKILLEYIEKNLLRAGRVDETVATMELLGKKEADRLFNQLGKTAKQQVLEFIKNGRYPKPKWTYLLEVGKKVQRVLM